jgi:hypothetical protein
LQPPPLLPAAGACSAAAREKTVAETLEWLDLFAEWPTPIEGVHTSQLLLQLAAATQLQHLGLDRVHLRSGTGGLFHLGALSCLTSLQLSSCALDDAAVLELLQAMPGLAGSLRSLSLMGNAEVTGVGGAIQAIATRLSQLTSLELSSTGAVDVAEEQLMERVVGVHSGCFKLRPIMECNA